MDEGYLKRKAAASTRLKRLRSSLGLTAAAFGEPLGKSASTIHRWESPSASVHPSVSDLYLLCSQYDISPTYLLFGFGQTHLSEIRDSVARAQLVDTFSALRDSAELIANRLSVANEVLDMMKKKVESES